MSFLERDGRMPINDGYGAPGRARTRVPPLCVRRTRRSVRVVPTRRQRMGESSDDTGGQQTATCSGRLCPVTGHTEQPTLYWAGKTYTLPASTLQQFMAAAMNSCHLRVWRPDARQIVHKWYSGPLLGFRDAGDLEEDCCRRRTVHVQWGPSAHRTGQLL